LARPTHLDERSGLLINLFFNGTDRNPGPHFLQALDNHPVTGFEP